jgi:hypothetical protein
MNSKSNWFLVASRDNYDWRYDGGTDVWKYFSSSRRTPGASALHLLSRPSMRLTRPGDFSPHASLPSLSEWNGREDEVPRLYAPYSPYDVCDAGDVADRGIGGMQRQVYQHARLKYGAVSLLLELPAYRATDVFGDAERQSWWAPDDLESEVRRINQDLIAPFNRLLELAVNPIPVGDSGAYVDVAITGLQAVDEGCLESRLFVPSTGAHQGGLATNFSTFGRKAFECEAKVLGDGAADFELALEILDRTSGTDTRSSRSYVGVGAEQTRTLRSSYRFLEGRDYSVRCEILGANESDASEILIENDQGCSASCATASCDDRCVATSGSTWDRTWRTNNHRQLDFSAVTDGSAVCDEGRARPQNVNGYPIGHIPAVVSF